ncbi:MULTISPECIES: DUF2509 family protein [Providencia]|uniref:DUF2509 family protein n=1 Tax=Providencia TaxID=586 RepID=UPI0030035044
MKHRIFQQQGNIALVMVVVLMTTALLLLKALHFYQENARNEFLKEKKYVEAFNQAESALSWGLQQSWTLQTFSRQKWQCQRASEHSWESCLKHYKGSQFILSGKGKYRGQYDVTLYRWVSPIPGTQKVRSQIKGWLDYCPVDKKGFCQ